MRNDIRVDVINNRIIMSAKFQKKALDSNSNEARELDEALQRCRRFHPNSDPTFETRTIEKNANKQTYEGLTKKYIYGYTQANGTAVQKRELDILLAIGVEAGVKAKPYGSIKQWFFANFPEYKNLVNAQNKIVQNVEQKGYTYEFPSYDLAAEPERKESTVIAFQTAASDDVA